MCSDAEQLAFYADLATSSSNKCTKEDEDKRAMKAGASGSLSAFRQVSLYDKIRCRVNELERERCQVGNNHKRLRDLMDEKDTCTKRYQIKRRRILEEEIEEVSREIQDIESGSKIVEFQKKAEPYIQAFQKQQFCRPHVVAMEDCHAPAQPSREFQVLNDYIVNVEGGTPTYDIDARDVCKRCNVPMHLHTTISMMVCTKCGETSPFLDATASLLSYSDDSYEYCSFSYKRINHFSEWIASMQAKESTEIPDSVLQIIMQRLKDERVDDVTQVTVQKIREILKNFKQRKYYEHTQLIHNKVTGAPPPRLSPEQEEKIKLLFMAASSAFSRVCPSDRRNFCSYSFVIQRLCKLLGYNEFVGVFPGLKGRTKIERQNAIWYRICKDLGWSYEESM